MNDVDRIIVEIEHLKKQVSELEKKVDNLMTAKNVGMGVLLALTAIAGGLGAFLNKLVGGN